MSNGNAQNLQTHCRHKGTGAPTPDCHKQPTLELTPLLPGAPSAPPGDNEGAQNSQIVNLPHRYVYSHTSLSSPQLFNPDAYAQESQHGRDFIPDMLTDEGKSTG